MNEVDERLWQRYRDQGDATARAQLLERHLGLVHHVARAIHVNLPDEVELDDLVSSGTLGLVRALESFDRSRGLAFSTYATPRIRGGILDDLRATDWIPRSVRSKARDTRNAQERLRGVLGRAPTDEETAFELNLELETYWRWREETEGGTLIPLDVPGTGDNENALALGETLAGSSGLEAHDSLQHEGEVAALQNALRDLPERERTVLALYYFEHLKLRQIAGLLHLTESRISQIRSQALRRLRRVLSPVLEV